MLAKTKAVTALTGSLALVVNLALVPLLATAADEEVEQTQPRDELRLLDDSAGIDGDDLGELEATIAALEEQLRLSEESLDRARLEYQELDSRLVALEEEIALLQNIIAVEDQRLAQLQAELEAQVAAGEQAAQAAANANSADSVPAANPAAGAAPNTPAEDAQSSGNTALVVGIAVVLGVVLFGLLSLTRRRAEANRAARARGFDPAFASDDPAPFDESFDDEPGFATEPERNRQRTSGFPPPYSAAAGGAAAAGQDGEEESFAFTLQEKPADNGSGQAMPAGKASRPGQAGTGSTLDYTALDNDELNFDDGNPSEGGGRAARSPTAAQDECDTKLDLATAYEAMGDVEDAIDILDEVIAEGKPAQVELAQRLKQSWQASL